MINGRGRKGSITAEISIQAVMGNRDMMNKLTDGENHRSGLPVKVWNMIITIIYKNVGVGNV